MDFHKGYTEVTAHILSNWPKWYENILENLEEKMDDNVDPLTIKKECDKILAKYDQINLQL